MGARRARTWGEKLAAARAKPGLPKVIVCEQMSTIPGENTLLIPSPAEVEALMRAVPEGRLTTVARIAELLAARHGAKLCCPFTTGIFAWLTAQAAEEAAAAGAPETTPWWRTLRGQGELNPKYPGGGALQSERLRREGHTLVAGKGKKPPRVADFVAHLAASE